MILMAQLLHTAPAPRLQGIVPAPELRTAGTTAFSYSTNLANDRRIRPARNRPYQQAIDIPALQCH